MSRNPRQRPARAAAAANAAGTVATVTASANLPAVPDPAPAWRSAFYIRTPWVETKSNFRRTGKGGAGSADWKRNQGFEALVNLELLRARPTGWDLGSPRADVSSRPSVVGFIFATTLKDAANLSKSIPDAAQRVVYHTDASLAYILSGTARRGPDTGCWISFALLDPGARRIDCLRAVWELSAQVSALIDVVETGQVVPPSGTLA